MNEKKTDLNWEEERGEKRGISDAVKKLIASGLSSAFMSEEGLRQYLSDVKLPTDVLAQIVNGARKSRDEMIQRAGGEISKMIQKIDLVAEARKIIAEHKIVVKAEIDFQPKKQTELEDLSEESSF